jgi:hypothetical protein
VFSSQAVAVAVQEIAELEELEEPVVVEVAQRRH